MRTKSIWFISTADEPVFDAFFKKLKSVFPAYQYCYIDLWKYEAPFWSAEFSISGIPKEDYKRVFSFLVEYEKLGIILIPRQYHFK